MKGITFGLFGLLVTLPRVVLMCLAWVLVHVCSALEGLQDWIDERSGIPQPDPEVEDDRARTFADIHTDFTGAQLMSYEEHVGDTLGAIVERHGTDWTYWDLKDWSTK